MCSFLRFLGPIFKNAAKKMEILLERKNIKTLFFKKIANFSHKIVGNCQKLMIETTPERVRDA
jgi:hypothetical protein